MAKVELNDYGALEQPYNWVCDNMEEDRAAEVIVKGTDPINVVNSQSFTINKAQYVSVHSRVGVIEGIEDFNGTARIKDASGATVFNAPISLATTTNLVYLTEQTYTIEIIKAVSSDFAEISVFYTHTLLDCSTGTTIPGMKAGGVRIQRITDFDGEQETIRRFKYQKVVDGITRSSGILVSPIDYRYIQNNQMLCNNYVACNLSCAYYAQNTAPRWTAEGSHIVYTEVEVLYGELGENGKKQSQFSYAPDVVQRQYPFGAITSYDWKRGLLLEQNILNANGDTIQTVINDYDFRATKSLKNHTIPAQKVAFKINNPLCFPADLIINDYEVIAPWYYLKSKTETLDGLTKTTHYQYNETDAGFHSNPTAVYFTNSNGKVYRSEMDYAHEKNLSCLINEYKIGIPVETRNYVDGIFQGGIRTDFQLFNTNQCLPHKKIELLKPAGLNDPPPEVERLVFSEYTSDGFVRKVQRMDFPLEVHDWQDGLLKQSTQGVFTRSWTHYPENRKVASATDIDGQIINYTYDAFQRLTNFTQRNNNISTTIEYNFLYELARNPLASSNYIQTKTQYSDAPTQTSTQTFDGLGRSLKILLNGVVKNEVIYDNLGRIAQQTYLPGNFTTLEYDDSPLNRITKQTYPDGSFSSTGYAAQGNYYKTSHTDENGQTTSTLTDLLGRTHQIINALGDTTSYEYADDRLNKPTKIIPPMGDHANFTYHYTYDERKRLKSKTLPQGGTRTYTYDDATDLPKTTTDANGNILSYAYDVYGREILKQLSKTYYSDPPQTISTATYDTGGGINIGKMTQSKVWKLETNTAFTTDYVYDNYGRMQQSTADNHIGGQDISTFTYNQADWTLTSLRKHTGYENLDIGMGYEYDGFGRITKTLYSLNGQAQLLSQNAWNNRDQLVRKILGNGLQKIDYQYNNRGWLTRINQPLPNNLPVPTCSGTTSIEGEELLNILDADIYCGQAIEDLNYIIQNRFVSPTFNVDCYNPCENTGEIHTTPDCTTAASNEQAASLLLARDKMKAAYTTEKQRTCADGSIATWYQPDASTMTLPTTLYRIRLCDGTQVYVFEEELTFITGTYYIIQAEDIQHPNQVFTIKDEQGVPRYIQLEELIHQVVAGEEVYLNHFQPNQNPCSPQDFNCSLEEQTQNESIFANILANNGTVKASDLTYPSYLYRVKVCGLGEIYLLPDELAQFPDNYAILQTIRLESATQSFMVGSTFDYTDGNDLFFLELHYNEAKAAIDATPQQNGNIAFLDWQVKNQLPQSYGFQYDALNRLKAAKHATGNYVANDAFGVNNISYDKNGNILSLQRHGVPQNPDDCYAIIDDLAYAYTGNQLTGVTELGDTERGFLGSDGGYTYDANGNLQFDGNRYATFDLYNHLNLPAAYVKYGAGYLEWDYDANGTKLQKRSFDNSSVAPGVALSDFAATPADETRDYVNGIEYVNNQLEAIYHEEGRIIKNNGNFEWQWCLKDHLGNTRLLFSDLNNDGEIDPANELLSISNYYPFGMSWENNTNTSPLQRHLYNGKELDTDFGLNVLFYGARLHDPALGRFTTLDPLAADFASWSTYHYTYNNPIRFIDPDGRAADDIINIEKSTGAITVTKAAGDDVVNLVDNGNVLNSAVYGKNGSFQEDNQIYQLESDAAPGVTSTIIMGTNEKALQTVYEVAANSDVEFGKLDVSSDGSPIKSLVVTSHQETSNPGLADLVKSLSAIGFEGSKQSHSHPPTITDYNESVPSGYYDNIPGNPSSLMPDLITTGKPYGDAGNAINVRSLKGFKNTKFEVYAPGNKTITTYDGVNRAKIHKN